MSEIESHFTPKRTLRPWTKTDEGITIFLASPSKKTADNDEVTTFNLNQTCADIWHMCDGDRTVGDIVEAMADKYDADVDVIADDVREVLKGLSEHGCVVLDHDSFF